MNSPQQFEKLFLTEELIMLMLNEQTGYLEKAPGWPLSCVTIGAVIADLALDGRIDTDPATLYIINDDPVGDETIDSILSEIAESSEDKDAQYWIERNAVHSELVVSNMLNRLVERGILEYLNGGFWMLSRDVARSGHYPGKSRAMVQECKSRIIGVIMNDTIPSPRDAILVSLLHSIKGFETLLSAEDYEEWHERIEFLANLDLIGRTVAQAIVDSVGRPKLRRTRPRQQMDKLRYIDLLRQRDLRSGNIPKGMLEISRQHGPILTMPFKIHKSPVVVAIGTEVNQWVNTYGRYYLRSKDYVQGLERAVGAGNSIPGMDGADHFKMRRAMQAAYSGPAFRERLPEAVHLCRQSLKEWTEGSVFRATQTLEDMIASQSSRLLINVDCSHYARELIDFEHRALATEVQGMLPHFMLRTPRMKRYRKRVEELRQSVLESHTPAQRRGQPGDIADAVLALHQKDPQFLPETDITFWFVFSMAAAIYLGSGLGFVMYCLNQRPDLREKVYKEAETVFGDGAELCAENFTADRFEVTQRVCMEAARLYPTFPIQLRTVMNDCTIAGFEIPAKTLLMTCQGAPHYDEDLYKSPLDFDIDRYLPDRSEHQARGAYVRFGLGTHACLGRHYADLQMILNTLLITYHVRLETLNPERELRIKPIPTSSPGKKLKFRVAEILNPI